MHSVKLKGNCSVLWEWTWHSYPSDKILVCLKMMRNKWVSNAEQSGEKLMAELVIVKWDWMHLMQVDLLLGFWGFFPPLTCWLSSEYHRQHGPCCRGNPTAWKAQQEIKCEYIWRFWKLVNCLKEGECDTGRKNEQKCALLYAKGSPTCTSAQLFLLH